LFVSFVTLVSLAMHCTEVTCKHLHKSIFTQLAAYAFRNWPQLTVPVTLLWF